MIEKQLTQKAENKIQQEIYVWFNNNFCLPIHEPREIIFHIPNEGKSNGKLISIGLYPGAADLVLSWRKNTIYCEVKTPEGIQSQNQKKFQKHVTQSGFKYEVVRSLEEFKKLISTL